MRGVWERNVDGGVQEHSSTWLEQNCRNYHVPYLRRYAHIRMYVRTDGWKHVGECYIHAYVLLWFDYMYVMYVCIMHVCMHIHMYGDVDLWMH